MPCGKRALVKTWDRPRNIRVAKPSRYQQNEASVKVHWKNVIRDLELFYKDEQFWESQSETVRQLVGQVIFERLTKIFSLPQQEEQYVPESEPSVVEPSEQFYMQAPMSSTSRSGVIEPNLSMNEFEYEGMGEGEQEEEESSSSSSWSNSSSSSTSTRDRIARPRESPSRAMLKSKSMSSKSVNISVSKFASKVMSRMFNRSVSRTFSEKYLDRKLKSPTESLASTDDDIRVHAKSHIAKKHKKIGMTGEVYNPHFKLLYCNDNEADMITWKSKYKKKSLEVSASDEYSKRAEILTKQIANEFYEWWVNVGSADYKSEIKCRGDIESLFQIWFDEHASRGLMLDPKIMPCVLQTIANYVGVRQASCPRALKRQIAWDIQAETSPAHTTAFNSSLPNKLKHIPPRNMTAEMWHAVRIPEDLKSMATVWEEITHLTSTKAFTKWLQQRPHLPTPPCLKDLGLPGDKRQLFVVPSDFFIRERSQDTLSDHDLNLPVSQFSLEIKEVLSRLLND